MAFRAVAISGSPRAPSKSKTLAELMLAELGRAGCDTSLIDVATLPAEALVARAAAPEIDAAIAQIADAQIIVAATPTYRALYTGVLKSFFDLMPHAHLAGKICVPLQTGGSQQHFLTIDYGLRPLFASLEGTPIGGCYASDDQFTEGKPDSAIVARIEQVAATAVAFARAG